MSNQPTVLKTMFFIRGAHAGQEDKAGRPYWLHPRAVSRAVAHLGADYERVALLHDVVEDTAVTFTQLRGLGYSEDVIEAVRLLTKVKDDGRTYAQYVRALARSGNDLAIRVKLADIDHNLSRMEALDPDVARGLGRRYARARETLTLALKDAS